MSRKKIVLSTILFLGYGLAMLQAQTLYVEENNGSTSTFTLSVVQKITFSSGNITIQNLDKSEEVYALSGLKQLRFKDFSTGIEDQIPTVNTNLLIYPNPVTNILNIDLTTTNREGIIHILTLEGKEIQKQKIVGQGIVKLNLSELPSGIYLCLYKSLTEIKTVKIIKQ